jgi:putative NADH-flavin reductase
MRSRPVVERPRPESTGRARCETLARLTHPVLVLFVLYAIALTVALALAGYRSPAAPTSSAGASPGRPTRVLIVGATGGTGRQLVAQALERGLTVTALVRDPSRLTIAHPHLTVVRGDVLDGGSVVAAVRGQEAVLLALGHKRYFSPNRILSEGTRNVLRAMEAHRVSRFVCETSLGIGDSAGRLGVYYTFFTIPVILPFYYWDKTRQERIIASSPVEWVIVRPGLLTNGAKRGRYRHGPRVGSFFWTMRISRADVADFMLNQLESDAYLRAAPGVCW